MKIINNVKADGTEYVKGEIYKMTKSDSIQKMSTIDGSFGAVGFIYYMDEKSDGTEVAILSIESSTHEIFATNSITFIRSFLDIYGMMEELPIDIYVGHGTSSKGRSYIYCDLA